MMLPPVHEKTELIEVVRITDPLRHYGAEDLVGDDVAIWEAAQVGETLTLIGSMPDSELYRCFNPGWGVRLWGPGVPGELTGIHTFDPDSPPALELLQRFRDSAPGPTA